MKNIDLTQNDIDIIINPENENTNKALKTLQSSPLF